MEDILNPIEESTEEATVGYALNLATDGRVLSATYPEYAPEDAVIVDSLPDGDITDYLYIDGEFIFDPPPLDPVDPPKPSTDDSYIWDELALALQEGVDSI